MNDPTNSPALSAVGGAANHGGECDGEPECGGGVHDEHDPPRVTSFHVLGTFVENYICHRSEISNVEK